jgi:hypothetical protein
MSLASKKSAHRQFRKPRDCRELGASLEWNYIGKKRRLMTYLNARQQKKANCGEMRLSYIGRVVEGYPNGLQSGKGLYDKYPGNQL